MWCNVEKTAEKISTMVCECKCEWMAFFYGIFRWMLFEVLVLMFNGTLSGCVFVMHSFSNIFVSCSDSFTYFLNGFRIWCLKCFVHSIACLFDSPEMLFDVCVCGREDEREMERKRELLSNSIPFMHQFYTFTSNYSHSNAVEIDVEWNGKRPNENTKTIWDSFDVYRCSLALHTMYKYIYIDTSLHLQKNFM